MARSYEEKVALFRYGVIADLIHVPPGKGSGLEKKLQDIGNKSYEIPGSRRTQVAAETARQWLYRYRHGSFEALQPKRRADTGKARNLSQEVVDLLLGIKEEQYHLSVPQVIAAARKHPEIVPPELELPRSTVHRQLAAAGLMRKRPKDPSSKDLRRFGFEKAGDLWMSDVMHGPSVFVEGRRKHKTYLIAFLDDATRVIPYAAFALSENTSAFLSVYREAVMRRGIPRRLYVDNGSAFVSHHVALVCAKLGVTLIHARPYHAAGKGKQERWFRTVRQQLLALTGERDLASVDALNRRLWAWIEGEYHQTPHRGLAGKTPFDAWAMRADQVHIPGPELDLDELFLFEEKRKVQRDRTVSLKGTIYEVDASLVGETVTLRYDPQKLGAPIDVWLCGERIQTAKVVDIYANAHVRRDHLSKTLQPDVADPAHRPDLPASVLNLRRLRKHQGEP